MANVNNPHGLRPLMRTMDGGEIQLFPMNKVVGYGTALFIQDVVNRVGSGNLQGGGTPGTTLWSGVTLNGGAASTATTHQVLVSSAAVYEAQDGNISAGILATHIGQNANLTFTVAGSATRPNYSGHQIDDNTVQTTSTLDLHLLALLNVPNNAFGPNARIEVIFNKSRMAGSAAGV